MPFFPRAASLLLVVIAAWTTSALAQDTPALSPPVAQGNTDVPYPPGAEGDAVVVLELVIEKDGAVSHAAVTEGVEPFAEHARTAVLGWRFSPARRGDGPVRARILARVRFEKDALGRAGRLRAPPGQVRRLRERGGGPGGPGGRRAGERTRAGRRCRGTDDDPESRPAKGPAGDRSRGFRAGRGRARRGWSDVVAEPDERRHRAGRAGARDPADPRTKRVDAGNTVSAESGRTTRVTVAEGSVVLRLRGRPPVMLGGGGTWEAGSVAARPSTPDAAGAPSGSAGLPARERIEELPEKAEGGSRER